MSAISGPIALYSNVPINAQYYEPSRFVIEDIALGETTTVTTTVAHNYVVGQNVRLLIPVPYGTFQLNNQEGYVVSIPSSTEVELSINSLNASAFIVSPFQYTITNATQTSPCVLTITQAFNGGSSVLIQNVSGMTQLNGNVYSVLAGNATTITINVNASFFSSYTSGGTATIYPTNGAVAQIIAIGDINSGQNNSNATMTQEFIPGSFINISPN